MGSSPPARGPLGHKFGHVATRGLIPACAGTTRLAGIGLRADRAHPRLRGDHIAQLLQGRDYEGSSPPARGPPSKILGLSAVSRLIPACAGTTRQGRPNRTHPWAHPRLRGDHRLELWAVGYARGSSPPARGPLSRCVRAMVPGRLIPACAGTTFSLCACYGAWPAHPRLRGDHYPG